MAKAKEHLHWFIHLFLWSPISGKYLTQEMLNLAFEILIKS